MNTQTQRQRFTFRINGKNHEFATIIENAGFTVTNTQDIKPLPIYNHTEQIKFTNPETGTEYTFKANGYRDDSEIRVFDNWEITLDGEYVACGEVLGQETLNWFETALAILCTK